MTQKQKVKGIGWLVWFSRLLLGGVFVFSGLVKAVDPLGTAYKIDDYLIAMGLPEWMSLSLPISIVMVVGEFALGMLLLLGIWRKRTLWLIGLFLFFFTPLTLWIALANPVEDCGCFGDALKIGNWETFWKNIILLAAWAILIIRRKDIVPLFGKKITPIVSLFVLLFGFLFALRNLYRLPAFDFRPYRIGASIPEQMQVDPELADVYETVFIYQKEGVEKEFSEDDYPWNDSTWTFVDMESRLVKEGVKPAIEDFAVADLNHDKITGEIVAGEDITEPLLLEPDWLFLMIAWSLEKMNLHHLKRFVDLQQFAVSRGYNFYLITASSSEVVAAWEKEHQTGFKFGVADERVLKTMIRSNPGLILLREGRVVNKWDDSKVPSPLAEGVSIETSSMVKVGTPQRRNMVRLLIVVSALLLPLFLLKLFERKGRLL